jgi:ankyrin repeat protein
MLLDAGGREHVDEPVPSSKVHWLYHDDWPSSERTLLHYAAGCDWREGVDYLLPVAAGIDVGGAGVGAYGWTPLHAAAERGAVSAMEALLGGGADACAAIDCRLTPLHALAGASSATPEQFQRAARMLVAAGADVNAVAVHKPDPCVHLRSRTLRRRGRTRV